MNHLMSRGERILLTVTVTLGAAAFMGYVGVNLCALEFAPTSDNTILGSTSISEMRSQFGQLGDFLNPILTGISLTFLALNFRGQQREWRAGRLFAMAQAYDKAIDELRMPDSDITGRAGLHRWVNEAIDGLAVDASLYNKITDKDLRSFSVAVEMSVALFHRPYLLLAQVVNAVGPGGGGVDDSASTLISAMTHQELVLFTLMAARPAKHSALLRAKLNARMHEVGLDVLSGRIAALQVPVMPEMKTP